MRSQKAVSRNLSIDFPETRQIMPEASLITLPQRAKLEPPPRAGRTGLATNYRPRTPNAPLATLSNDCCLPLALANNIAPSSAAIRSFALSAASFGLKPAATKTCDSHRSFSLKKDLTSTIISTGMLSASAAMIPQSHMRPCAISLRNRRTYRRSCIAGANLSASARALMNRQVWRLTRHSPSLALRANWGLKASKARWLPGRNLHFSHAP